MTQDRPVAIVMTTIFDPEALDVYASNTAKYGHESTAQVIVIGDRKVHPDILGRIDRLNRQYGEIIDWWDFDRQIAWLQEFAPSMIDDIPANSDNRRNVGYLVALSRGADVVVSVDDDNFPLDDSDFVLEHAKTGQEYEGPIIDQGGWFNIMNLLESDPAIPMWPRGYPYKHRDPSASDVPSTSAGRLRVGLNAGLWLGDPDIDAITRISIHPDAKSVKADETVLKNTLTPINSQNTSVVADLLPAYYYLRQDEPLFGWNVNRFGDIWQGLFVEAVGYHLGYGLRVGTPAVRQLRNEHDLLVDLRQEFPGLLVNEWLGDLIAEFKFTSSDAGSAVLELYEEILRQLPSRTEFPPDVTNYFRRVSETAARWVDACRSISS